MKRISSSVLKDYKEQFTNVLRKAAIAESLFKESLTDFLTPAEYDTLALRWQIVKMLAGGASHREVATKLKIGVATVARGSRELRNPNGGFHLLLKKEKDSR